MAAQLTTRLRDISVAVAGHGVAPWECTPVLRQNMPDAKALATIRSRDFWAAVAAPGATSDSIWIPVALVMCLSDVFFDPAATAPTDGGRLTDSATDASSSDDDVADGADPRLVSDGLGTCALLCQRMHDLIAAPTTDVRLVPWVALAASLLAGRSACHFNSFALTTNRKLSNPLAADAFPRLTAVLSACGTRLRTEQARPGATTTVVSPLYEYIVQYCTKAVATLRPATPAPLHARRAHCLSLMLPLLFAHIAPTEGRPANVPEKPIVIRPHARAFLAALVGAISDSTNPMRISQQTAQLVLLAPSAVRPGANAPVDLSTSVFLDVVGHLPRNEETTHAAFQALTHVATALARPLAGSEPRAAAISSYVLGRLLSSPELWTIMQRLIHAADSSISVSIATIRRVFAFVAALGKAAEASRAVASTATTMAFEMQWKGDAAVALYASLVAPLTANPNLNVAATEEHAATVASFFSCVASLVTGLLGPKVASHPKCAAAVAQALNAVKVGVPTAATDVIFLETRRDAANCAAAVVHALAAEHIARVRELVAAATVILQQLLRRTDLRTNADATEALAAATRVLMRGLPALMRARAPEKELIDLMRLVSSEPLVNALCASRSGLQVLCGVWGGVASRVGAETTDIVARELATSVARLWSQHVKASGGGLKEAFAATASPLAFAPLFAEISGSVALRSKAGFSRAMSDATFWAGAVLAPIGDVLVEAASGNAALDAAAESWLGSLCRATAVVDSPSCADITGHAVLGSAIARALHVIASRVDAHGADNGGKLLEQVKNVFMLVCNIALSPRARAAVLGDAIRDGMCMLTNAVSHALARAWNADSATRKDMWEVPVLWALQAWTNILAAPSAATAAAAADPSSSSSTAATEDEDDERFAAIALSEKKVLDTLFDRLGSAAFRAALHNAAKVDFVMKHMQVLHMFLLQPVLLEATICTPINATVACGYLQHFGTQLCRDDSALNGDATWDSVRQWYLCVARTLATAFWSNPATHSSVRVRFLQAAAPEPAADAPNAAEHTPDVFVQFRRTALWRMVRSISEAQATPAEVDGRMKVLQWYCALLAQAASNANVGMAWLASDAPEVMASLGFVVDRMTGPDAADAVKHLEALLGALCNLGNSIVSGNRGTSDRHVVVDYCLDLILCRLAAIVVSQGDLTRLYMAAFSFTSNTVVTKQITAGAGGQLPSWALALPNALQRGLNILAGTDEAAMRSPVSPASPNTPPQVAAAKWMVSTVRNLAAGGSLVMQERILLHETTLQVMRTIVDASCGLSTQLQFNDRLRPEGGADLPLNEFFHFVRQVMSAASATAGQLTQQQKALVELAFRIPADIWTAATTSPRTDVGAPLRNRDGVTMVAAVMEFFASLFRETPQHYSHCMQHLQGLTLFSKALAFAAASVQRFAPEVVRGAPRNPVHIVLDCMTTLCDARAGSEMIVTRAPVLRDQFVQIATQPAVVSDDATARKLFSAICNVTIALTMDVTSRGVWLESEDGPRSTARLFAAPVTQSIQTAEAARLYCIALSNVTLLSSGRAMLTRPGSDPSTLSALCDVLLGRVGPRAAPSAMASRALLGAISNLMYTPENDPAPVNPAYADNGAFLLQRQRAFVAHEGLRDVLIAPLQGDLPVLREQPTEDELTDCVTRLENCRRTHQIMSTIKWDQLGATEVGVLFAPEAEESESDEDVDEDSWSYAATEHLARLFLTPPSSTEPRVVAAYAGARKWAINELRQMTYCETVVSLLGASPTFRAGLVKAADQAATVLVRSPTAEARAALTDLTRAVLTAVANLALFRSVHACWTTEDVVAAVARATMACADEASLGELYFKTITNLTLSDGPAQAAAFRAGIAAAPSQGLALVLRPIRRVIDTLGRDAARALPADADAERLGQLRAAFQALAALTSCPEGATAAACAATVALYTDAALVLAKSRSANADSAARHEAVRWWCGALTNAATHSDKLRLLVTNSPALTSALTTMSAAFTVDPSASALDRLCMVITSDDPVVRSQHATPFHSEGDDDDGTPLESATTATTHRSTTSGGTSLQIASGLNLRRSSTALTGGLMTPLESARDTAHDTSRSRSMIKPSARSRDTILRALLRVPTTSGTLQSNVASLIAMASEEERTVRGGGNCLSNDNAGEVVPPSARGRPSENAARHFTDVATVGAVTVLVNRYSSIDPGAVNAANTSDPVAAASASTASVASTETPRDPEEALACYRVVLSLVKQLITVSDAMRFALQRHAPLCLALLQCGPPVTGPTAVTAVESWLGLLCNMSCNGDNDALPLLGFSGGRSTGLQLLRTSVCRHTVQSGSVDCARWFATMLCNMSQGPQARAALAGSPHVAGALVDIHPLVQQSTDGSKWWCSALASLAAFPRTDGAAPPATPATSSLTPPSGIASSGGLRDALMTSLQTASDPNVLQWALTAFYHLVVGGPFACEATRLAYHMQEQGRPLRRTLVAILNNIARTDWMAWVCSILTTFARSSQTLIDTPLATAIAEAFVRVCPLITDIAAARTLLLTIGSLASSTNALGRGVLACAPIRDAMLHVRCHMRDNLNVAPRRLPEGITAEDVDSDTMEVLNREATVVHEALEAFFRAVYNVLVGSNEIPHYGPHAFVDNSMLVAMCDMASRGEVDDDNMAQWFCTTLAALAQLPNADRVYAVESIAAALRVVEPALQTDTAKRCFCRAVGALTAPRATAVPTAVSRSASISRRRMSQQHRESLQRDDASSLRAGSLEQNTATSTAHASPFVSAPMQATYCAFVARTTNDGVIAALLTALVNLGNLPVDRDALATDVFCSTVVLGTAAAIRPSRAATAAWLNLVHALTKHNGTAVRLLLDDDSNSSSDSSSDESSEESDDSDEDPVRGARGFARALCRAGISARDGSSIRTFCSITSNFAVDHAAFGRDEAMRNAWVAAAGRAQDDDTAGWLCSALCRLLEAPTNDDGELHPVTTRRVFATRETLTAVMHLAELAMSDETIRLWYSVVAAIGKGDYERHGTPGPIVTESHIFVCREVCDAMVAMFDRSRQIGTKRQFCAALVSLMSNPKGRTTIFAVDPVGRVASDMVDALDAEEESGETGVFNFGGASFLGEEGRVEVANELIYMFDVFVNELYQHAFDTPTMRATLQRLYEVVGVAAPSALDATAAMPQPRWDSDSTAGGTATGTSPSPSPEREVVRRVPNSGLGSPVPNAPLVGVPRPLGRLQFARVSPGRQNRSSEGAGAAAAAAVVAAAGGLGLSGGNAARVGPRADRPQAPRSPQRAPLVPFAHHHHDPSMMSPAVDERGPERDRSMSIQSHHARSPAASMSPAAAARADCLICFSANRAHACVPCGHRVFCTDCRERFEAHAPRPLCCPLCRAEVLCVIKVFL